MPDRLPRIGLSVPLAGAALALLFAGPAAPGQDVPSLKLPPGTPQGYLAPADLPDSLALLPPPPPADSAAFARDEEVSKATARPSGSPRFAQAASDADLKFDHLAQTFTCAAGVAPDPQATPVLYRLLHKAMIDIGLSTYKAKNRYQRVRPFVVHGNSSCFPPDEAALRKDGSYPSGHSAIGWGWALLFAEMVPHHADAILQRGRDFGESRLVCNVHWASDVDAGRLIAAATVARLHGDPEFRRDILEAKAEAMRAPISPDTGCAAQAAALSGG